MVLQQPTKIATFEPHLHAPGMRMCLEAIWGINIQTLTCAGYDHNWVRGYAYDDDYAPLPRAGRGLRPRRGARLRVRRRLRAAAAEGDDPPHHRLHGQHAGEQEHPRPAK